MTEILNSIKNLGYKIENKNNEIIIYSVDENGYINDDIYFIIDSNNQLFKVERNFKTLIGVNNSVETAILTVLFKLKSTTAKRIETQQIKDEFSKTTSLNEVKAIFTKIFGQTYVDNNIFLNEEVNGKNGFYINGNEEINIIYKQGNYYFLVASKSFEKRKILFPKLVEFIYKKSQCDQELRKLQTPVDDKTYIELLSNYSFGFTVAINEIEKKNKVK